MCTRLKCWQVACLGAVIAGMFFMTCCKVQNRTRLPELLIHTPLSDSVLTTLKSFSDSTVVKKMYGRLNLEALIPEEARSQDSLMRRATLKLLSDSSFVIYLDRLTVRSPISYSWFGRVEDFEDSQVTLVVNDSVLVGNIRLLDSFYQIRFAGRDMHAMLKVKAQIMPTEVPPIVPDIEPRSP